MFALIERYAEALAIGFFTTVFMTVSIWAIGLAGGIAFGVVGAGTSAWLGRTIKFLAFLAVALPTLVVLYWMHFPLQRILGIPFEPLWVTIIVLGTINLLMVASLIIGAIQQIPEETSEAGRAMGLSASICYRRVLLPTAIQSALPSIVGLQLTMLHMTIFGAFISVNELFRTISRINAIEKQPIEAYTILAIMFAIICVPVAYIQHRLQHKFDHSR